MPRPLPVPRRSWRHRARHGHDLLAVNAYSKTCCSFLADPDSSYTNLSPKARLGLGLGIMGWGVVGMYLFDPIVEKTGFTPSEEDKEALRRIIPKISIVDKDEKP